MMQQLSFAVTAFTFFAASLAAQEVFTPGNGVSLPTVVKQVRPEYTEAAKAARIEGDVVMQAIVLADGRVGDVAVTKSLDSVNGLDDQAVTALKLWVFEPGTKDGIPVAVRIYVQTRFTLK
jgi:protein TonB